MKALRKVTRFIRSLWTGAIETRDEHPALSRVGHSDGRRDDWNDRRHLIGYRIQHGLRVAVFVLATALLTHASCLGRTGRGKSKLAMLCLQDYVRWGWGLLLTDPKSTLVEELLANIMADVRRTNCDAILRRIVLIEISPDSVPTISALRWNGLGSQKVTHHENAMRAFFAKEADVLIEIIHRIMGEDEQGGPRIKRLLRAVFQAVAAAGLDLVDSVTLLDPFAANHERVWEACKATGQLPSEVVSDLEMIHALKRPQDALTQVEGPLNRLRMLLSPLLRAAFSESMDAIDFGDAVRQRKIILVVAKETPFVSRQQGLTLVSIVLHRVIEARFSMTDEELAHEPPFPVICDEAAETYGPDSDRVFRVGRSLKMPMMLFTQNLSAYRRKDEDYTETVLNEPGLLYAFQTKVPSPELVDVLLHGRIDFTQATREVDRPDGYDFVALPSVSKSRRRSVTVSSSRGTLESQGQTLSVGESESQEAGHSIGREQRRDTRQSIDISQSASTEHSRRKSRGRSSEQSEDFSRSYTTETRHGQSTGTDTTTGQSTSRHESRSHQSGSQRGTTDSARTLDERGYRRLEDGSTAGYGTSSQQASRDSSLANNESSSFGIDRSEETSHSTTRRTQVSSEQAERHGQTSGERYSQGRSTTNETGTADRDQSGLSVAQSTGTAQSQSLEHSLSSGTGRTRGVAIQTGGSTSESSGLAVGADVGETVGYSLSPLARHRTVIETLPQLAEGLDVQRAKIAAELSTLGVAEMLMRDDTTCETIRVRVRNVPLPFEDPREYFAAIDEARERLREMHDYMKTPDLSREAEQRRVDQHLHRLEQERQATAQPRLPADDSPAESDEQQDTPFH